MNKINLRPVLYIAIIIATLLSIRHISNTQPTNNNVKHLPIKEKADSIKKNDAQIPVLCYHQVRNWNTHDSKSDKVFIIPPATFNEHIKTLKDSGYTAILPDQLIAYMQKKTLLPKKPVMLTFDDGTSSQYINALPILNKAGFKATFFIMTVTIGHKAYLSSAQIKDLSDNGHVIGCHTGDHTPVTKYGPNDWNIQLTQPKQLLEKITGKPVKYFAYPYGTWNNESIIKLKANNYTAAFQLYTPGDEENSNYTIKRIIADSRWTGKQLIAEMKKNFK